jgi:hypothetical protein
MDNEDAVYHVVKSIESLQKEIRNLGYSGKYSSLETLKEELIKQSKQTNESLEIIAKKNKVISYYYNHHISIIIQRIDEIKHNMNNENM